MSAPERKTPDTVEEFLKMWRDGYTEEDRVRDVREAEAALREVFRKFPKRDDEAAR